ncbi:ATP-binding protein [Microbulbifer elongatus]|uniref:ATP-binding protein n=1 Tax=Microbulbifer elongatus TaxID=86173 RepID=UPI001E5C3A4A|nr:ATP-binding protein [Microbulbifer elongatus]
MSESPALADIVKTEQAKFIFKHAPTGTISNVIVSSAVYFIGERIVPGDSLWHWFWAVQVMVIFRLGVIFYFRYAAKEKAANHQMACVRLYSFGVFLTALSWCYGLILFSHPVPIAYQVIVQMILVGFCVGALSSGYAYMPSVLAYVAPISATIFMFSLLSDHPAYKIMAVAYPLYALVITKLCYSTSNEFKNNLKLQHELNERRIEAEKANSSKSQFLAATSHDLRQPLHAISLFCGALKNMPLPSQAEPAVENISKSIEPLSGLFSGLLDISKLDADIVSVEKEDVELGAALEPLRNEFSALASEKSIDFAWHIEENIVSVDIEILRRIVRNLLSNAFKYTNAGRIELIGQAQSGSISLAVKDTGIGVAKADQEIIFEEYVQLNNPERDRSRGLGLGLAIVSRLCRLMKYKLHVDSTPGKGSSFYFSIPISHVKPYRKPSANPLANFDELYVVVIDDEKSIREGTKLLLESWGCSTDTFPDKDSTINHLKQKKKKPELILADYRLSNYVSGIDVIKAIRELFEEPILSAVISGDTAPEPLKEVEKNNLLLLHKPINLAKLRSLLNQAKREKTQILTTGI